VSDPVEVVLTAINAGDVDAFVACYAEDATIEDGDGEIRVRGRDELRATYGAMFERHPALRVTALSRIDVGRFVVQEERVDGRSPAPERHVAVYTVSDELIVRERLLR
jgi:hypothetical protein